jgi:hypothetical protein
MLREPDVQAEHETDARAQAALTSQLSDALHRGLATPGSTSAPCWLLLDPSPLGLSESDEPLAGGLLTHPTLCRVKPARADLPEDMAPALLALDAAESGGSALLAQSLALALGELSSQRLAQGQGRVVAAWLECDGELDASQAALQRHLARTLFTRRPDGRIQWLRWYDPAVLWLLWPRLDARQQHYLLGPIRRCWLLTPSAELACLQAPQPPEAEPLTALGLTDAQWAVVDAISALNLALAQTDASSLDATTLQRVADTGMSAITRAQQAGWSDRQDLALYARIAITRHAHFDRHPSVSQRLQAARPGDFFSAAIDGITEDQWHHIKRDLDDATATTITSSRALRP